LRTVVTKNKELAGPWEEQCVHDEALATAWAEHAKVQVTTMQKEKGIKKAEKALDGKVCDVLSPVFRVGSLCIN
jgi:structural maintenance of chromosome 1